MSSNESRRANNLWIGRLIIAVVAAFVALGVVQGWVNLAAIRGPLLKVLGITIGVLGTVAIYNLAFRRADARQVYQVHSALMSMLVTLVLVLVAFGVTGIVEWYDEEAEAKHVAREFATALYEVDDSGAGDQLRRMVSSGKVKPKVADGVNNQVTRSEVTIEETSVVGHTHEGLTVRVRGKVKVFHVGESPESRPVDLEMKIQARESPSSKERRLEVAHVAEVGEN